MSNWTSFFAASSLALTAPITLAYAQDQTAEPVDEVLLVADNVRENQDDNTVIAEGNVEARYQNRVLRADRIIYNRNTDKVRASGNVVILDDDGTQRFADEVEVDSDLEGGYAIGFSARLPGGGKTAANAAIRRSDGVNALDQVVYTACETCDEDDTPTWTIRARRAVLDQNSGMFSYRDAVVEVGGVPVFYLPFMAHPDPSSGRRSGFLPPNAGASTKVGGFWQQPYYWAISPYSDLTISPLITTQVNPVLELDYRKRFWSGSIDINTSLTEEFIFDGDGVRANEDGFRINTPGVLGCDTNPEEFPGIPRTDCDKSLRSHIYANGLFNINKKWAWGFGLERMSDDLYTRRYNIDGENKRRGLYNSQPRRLLTQAFVVGQETDFYADAAVFSIQGLRQFDDDAALPTGSPVFFAEQLYDFGGYGLAAINTSGAVLNREIGEDSRRVSVGGDWSTQSILPGGLLFEPFTEARVDYYSLDEDISGDANVARAVGDVGARLSYPVARYGEWVDIIIKPTAMVSWGLSNANDPVIPNEDSQLFELDETSLFEGNGFSNVDLYEGDGKAALGFSTQMRWRGGTTIDAIAGRRWRSRADPTLPVSSNLDGTVSDWVAGLSANLAGRVRVNTRVRLDDKNFDLNRIDASATASLWRIGLALEYFKVDGDISFSGRPDEGIRIRSNFRVTDRYSLVYSRLRNIEDGFDALHAIGVAYTDDCSRFEIAYERTEFNDRTLGPSDSIQFRFTLKTLGDFGSSEFD